MFDDLREQAENSFLDAEDELEEGSSRFDIDSAKLLSIFANLTQTQRIIILALLLVVICLVSVLCLLMTGRIAPPIP
jgi:hypothetical protein